MRCNKDATAASVEKGADLRTSFFIVAYYGIGIAMQSFA